MAIDPTTGQQQEEAAVDAGLKPTVTISSLSATLKAALASVFVVLGGMGVWVGGHYQATDTALIAGNTPAPSATTDTTNADNITSGTLSASRTPAYTGDVAKPAGSGATTIQPGAVTAGKMGAGAAAGNIGVLGGDLQGSLPNPTANGKLSHVTNVTALAGSSSAAFPAHRDDVSVDYNYSTSACSLNNGAGDNGYQVKPTAAGLTTGCWVATLPAVPDSSIWGATGKLGNSVDVAPMLTNMFAGLQAAGRRFGHLAAGVHRIMTPVIQTAYRFKLSGDGWQRGGPAGSGSWISESSSMIAATTTASAATSASKTLTVASATGIAAGQSVIAPGITSGALVQSVSGTTVTLNQIASVPNGATVTFGYSVFAMDGNGMQAEDIGFVQDQPTPSTTANTAWTPYAYPGIIQLGANNNAPDGQFRNLFCFQCYMMIDGAGSDRMTTSDIWGECEFRCIRVGASADTQHIDLVHNFIYATLLSGYTQAQIDNVYRWRQANAGAVEMQRSDNPFIDRVFCFSCQFDLLLSSQPAGGAPGGVSRAHINGMDGDATKFTIWSTGTGNQFQASNITATGADATSIQTGPQAGSAGIEVDAGNTIADVASIRCSNMGRSCARILSGGAAINSSLHVGIGRVENWSTDSAGIAAWDAGPANHIDLSQVTYDTAGKGPQINGDVQQPRMELSALTSATSPNASLTTDLFRAAPSMANQIAVPLDTTVNVAVTLTGRDPAAATTYNVALRATLKNAGGTVTQIGSTNVTNLGQDSGLASSVSYALGADNTNKAVTIFVTQTVNGTTYGGTIYWRATATADVAVNY